MIAEHCVRPFHETQTTRSQRSHPAREAVVWRAAVQQYELARMDPNRPPTRTGVLRVDFDRQKKVLDFVQFGGLEGTVLRTFRWEIPI